MQHEIIIEQGSLTVGMTSDKIIEVLEAHVKHGNGKVICPTCKESIEVPVNLRQMIKKLATNAKGETVNLTFGIFHPGPPPPSSNKGLELTDPTLDPIIRAKAEEMERFFKERNGKKSIDKKNG